MARTTHLSVEELSAIESGAKDPAFSLVQELVEASGSKLILGIKPTETADEHDFTVGLLDAVSNLLFLTSPHDSYPVEVASTWIYVALGLQTQSWQLVHSAQLAYALGHGAPLMPTVARTVFENVATTHWLSEDPAERRMTVIRDANRNAKLLRDLEPETYARRMARWTQAFGDSDPFGRLPPFEQRLVPPMTGWYAKYRILSRSAHASADAAEDVLVRENGALITRHRLQSGGQLLAFAAVNLWFMAHRLELGFPQAGAPTQRTALGFDGDAGSFVALGKRINEFIAIDPHSESKTFDDVIMLGP
ncbi:hypothetical protein [Nocardioides terrigena]|uniref:hypothetical protein n=1 Tax=Nocardioides terrigena TaxID=424797 RepID=UPI00131EDE15|nr:hypothetical protein [Nocardioides terrigena]